MEPEVAISSNQVRLPVEGGRHQPTHKTIDPNFFLPPRSVRIKMEQRLSLWPTNGFPNWRPIPWERTNTISDTLLCLQTEA